MEHLGCIHITRALVQINGRAIKSYSHFGKIQAAKNAVWKYKRTYGSIAVGEHGLGLEVSE